MVQWKLSKSILATSISHMRMQFAFLKSKYTYGWFFEDDIDLNSIQTNTPDDICRFIRNAPSDWQTLYPGFCYECKHIPGTNRLNNVIWSNENQYYKAIIPRCRHSYIANRDASRALSRSVLPIYASIDDMFANCHRNQYNLTGYLPKKPLLEQDHTGILGSQSSVDLNGNIIAPKHNRRFTYIHFVKCNYI